MASKVTKSSPSFDEPHLFKALDPEAKERLLSSGQRVTFREGEAILREGEEGDCFFLIERGEVVVTTEGLGQGRVELACLSEGSIFGEVPVFSRKPRTATVTATTEVEALRFENEALQSLLDENPKAREELANLILNRARDTIEKTIGGR